ncbi:MAG: phosphatidylglycerol lysyltransferase domain-containing protein [Monoglobales bacterium]
MINPKEITIKEKDLFDSFFGQYKKISQEVCFSNLFIWKAGYNMKYDVVDGFLVIFAGYDAVGEYFHMPIGNGDKQKVLLKLDEYMMGKYGGYSIRKLLTEEASELDKFMPGKFEFEKNREFFDYIYNVSDLVSLRGKKYHSKKNHLNTFINTYDYKYNIISEDNIEKCAYYARQWILERNPDSYMEEYTASKVLFENFFELGLKGAFLTVNDEIVAITVGENNFGTVIIHFEKADPKVKGVYAAINQMFLQNEFSDAKYVNREEDLGIEGLRKAKLSYKPAILLEKITAKRI